MTRRAGLFCDYSPRQGSIYPDTPSVGQLSQVISQAAAPAFLLGALAAFIAVLVSRLNRIIDRTIVLNAISDDDTAGCRLKADLPRLMRRAAMLNRAIFWAVIGSIAVTLLVIVAIASAVLRFSMSAASPSCSSSRSLPSRCRWSILPGRCASH
jgi:hypothetical protein